MLSGKVKEPNKFLNGLIHKHKISDFGTKSMSILGQNGTSGRDESESVILVFKIKYLDLIFV